jgi:uncharacterized membrane protein YeiH
VTGVGGGSVRDVLIGAPGFWVRDPWVAPVVLATALIAWFTPQRWWEGKMLDWADALGLAFYSVLGTAKALAYGVEPVPAALMGVITGCVGGIIRDVFAGQPSILMRPELYVTAAALAATLCAAGTLAGLPPEIVWTAASLAGFVLRGAALIWKIELPAYSREADSPYGLLVDVGRLGRFVAAVVVIVIVVRQRRRLVLCLPGAGVVVVVPLAVGGRGGGRAIADEHVADPAVVADRARIGGAALELARDVPAVARARRAVDRADAVLAALDLADAHVDGAVDAAAVGAAVVAGGLVARVTVVIGIGIRIVAVAVALGRAGDRGDHAEDRHARDHVAGVDVVVVIAVMPPVARGDRGRHPGQRRGERGRGGELAGLQGHGGNPPVANATRRSRLATA